MPDVLNAVDGPVNLLQESTVIALHGTETKRVVIVRGRYFLSEEEAFL